MTTVELMSTQDFARALRVLRASRGLKQSELAEAVGVDTSTISVWESGRRQNPPPVQQVKLLEEHLHSPPGLLVEAAGYIADTSELTIGQVIAKHRSDPEGNTITLPKSLTNDDIQVVLDLVETLAKRRAERD